MSLEAAIAELTAAVKENTATVKGLAKGAAATASTKPSTTKSQGPTQKDVADRFGAYLNLPADQKAERKERIAKMGKINAHFGVAKITDAKPAQWVEALEMLDKLEAGEDPFDDDEGAGESLV